MFDNRNTSRIGTFAIALVVLLSAVGLGVGGVAALDNPVLVDDEPITPTNSTESLYLDVTGMDDMNASGPVNVTVTVEGLNETETVGNGTQLDTTTLSVAAGSVESYSYVLADTDSEYDTIVLTSEVETAGDESLIASVDWGVLEQISGGGGGGIGSVGGVPIIAILAIVGLGYIVTKD